MSEWDDPEFKTGDFVKFTNPGDAVTGTLAAIGRMVWDDGKVSPQLTLTGAKGTGTVVIGDSGDAVLTAGQANLKAQLVELRPSVGDVIYVKFERVEARGGGKTLKRFEVQVKAAGQAAAAPHSPAVEEPPF